VPQSIHFKTLSWYSIGEALPFRVPALHGRPEWEGSGSHRGQEIYIPLMLPLGFGPPCAAHHMDTDLLTYSKCRKTKQTMFFPNFSFLKLCSFSNPFSFYLGCQSGFATASLPRIQLGYSPAFVRIMSDPNNSRLPRLRGTGRPPERPALSLVLFLTCFLAAALTSQRFFYSLSLAGLKVKRVTLYFLNNVLGLYLPLEPPKRVFEGFALLKSNFRQRTTPPHSS